MKQISWLLPCLFLTACGTSVKDVRDYFNPYLGQRYDLVIADLGVPTSCAEISTGGKVCEWDKTYNSYYLDSGGTVERHYHFVLNKEGVVTEWRWKGRARKFILHSFMTLSSNDTP
jgi:hypothetical protein